MRIVVIKGGSWWKVCDFKEYPRVGVSFHIGDGNQSGEIIKADSEKKTFETLSGIYYWQFVDEDATIEVGDSVIRYTNMYGGYSPGGVAVVIEKDEKNPLTIMSIRSKKTGSESVGHSICNFFKVVDGAKDIGILRIKKKTIKIF